MYNLEERYVEEVISLKNWMSGKRLGFCALALLLLAAACAAPAYSEAAASLEPGDAYMAHGCHGGGHHYYDYHRGPGYCG